MKVNFAQGLDHFRHLVLAPTAGSHDAPDEIIFNCVSALLRDFDAARSGGIFNPLPEEEPGDARDASRVRPIRSRLACLGYLGHDSGLSIIDPILTQAIRQFQHDAGLIEDGWVGRQTWHALQELVGFERQEAIGCWFVGGHAGPALQRAIAWRLHVLGLTDTPAFNDPGRLAAGLQHFQTVAAFLHLPGQDIRPEICMETIAPLFDQELLVEKLADLESPLPRETGHPLFAFAAGVAKVELWLAGYDVTPAGTQAKEHFRAASERRSGRHRLMPMERQSRLNEDPELFSALTTYWLDHGKDKESASLAQRFAGEFPAFFRMIAAAIRARESLGASGQSAMIYHLLAKQPEQLETIWQTSQSLGNRMWDGTGRVFGWYQNLTRQPGGKTVGIGENIARLVYHQAMTAYDTVRRALQDFPDLLAGILPRQWPGSDPGHIVMRRDGDLAFKVYINTGGDQERISRFMDSVAQTSASFAAACRLIAIFLPALRSNIREGKTGWAGLILTLLQVSPGINRSDSRLLAARVAD